MGADALSPRLYAIILRRILRPLTPVLVADKTELQTNSVRGRTKRFASSHETRSHRSPATPDVFPVCLTPFIPITSLSFSFSFSSSLSASDELQCVRVLFAVWSVELEHFPSVRRLRSFVYSLNESFVESHFFITQEGEPITEYSLHLIEPTSKIF